MCPGSPAAAAGAGAYPVWTGSDKLYRVPGAKRWTGSQPSPRADDRHARLDAELLFLPAFRAVGQAVLEPAILLTLSLHHH